MITAVSTGLIWRPGIIPPTTVTVRNSAARRADCEIWWILARQREARPWEHPVMRSQPVRVQLAPFKSRTVGVNVLLVNSRQVGTFALSVWAHCRSSAATGWAPSDGATMGGGVEVLGPSQQLERSPENSSFYWVYELSAVGRLRQGRPGEVRVEVANAWVEPVLVEVLCYLAPPRVARPWEDPLAARCDASDVNLPAVAITTVNLEVAKMPEGGRYQLSVWLHLVRAADNVPVDGARLRTRVVVDA